MGILVMQQQLCQYVNLWPHYIILWWHRGPEGVKIENSDSPVATLTGLQVGTYTFKLTVTDERELQSSDTVTVIAREGM